MNRIDYTSVLAVGYRTELEALLFFNPEQHRFREKIRTVIEKYGVPAIHAENDRLYIRLDASSKKSSGVPLTMNPGSAGVPPAAGPTATRRRDASAPRHHATGHGSEVQTLYALAGSKAGSQLVGVVVYTRSDPGTITVLHIAVSEDYSSQGRHHKQMMVPLFIGKLREIGRQIKGVAMLRLLYDTEFRDIPV